MDSSLSRRYRDAHPVHETETARLEMAHDLVRDAPVWLLRARGLDFEDAAVTLRLRAHAVRDVDLTRCDPGAWVFERDDDDVVVAMPPIVGEPWIGAWTAGTPEDRARMGAHLSDGLRGLAAAGIPLVAPDALALIETRDGPRLLPSAWLVPPPVTPGATTRVWDEAASRPAVATFVEALGRRGVELPGVAAPPAATDHAVDLEDAIAASAEGTAWSIPAGGARDPDRLARRVGAVTRAAARLDAQLLRLDPDHRLHTPPRTSGRPVVILVAGARAYADVAVALEALAGTEWMDGHERLVWLDGDPAPDAVRTLFLEARYGPAHGVLDVGPDHASVADADPAPRARFLLEALAVADADLPVTVLQRLARADADALAEVVAASWRAGDVRVVVGEHVVSSHRRTTVGLRRAIDVNDDRRAEVRALLPEALEGISTRRLDTSWWRARLFAVADAGEIAVRALRDVARRAEDRGLTLLASSAHERLAALPGGASLDDEIRAAALRAETLQRTGDLDAAQATLETALARVAERPDAADPTRWADVVFRAVQLDFHRSDFVTAEERLRELLERSRNELPPEPRAHAYGEMAWAQLHRGRTGDAVRTAELALRRLDPLQHGALVARLHNLVGFALYKQSDYSQSLVHYDRALRLRDELGDDMGVARTQNNMALSHLALGQIGEAEATLLDSLRRKRAAGDDLSMAASLINLGLVRLEKADHEGTEDVARQALEIAQLRRHPETEAESWGLLGDVALARGDAASARELFERDLAICEENGLDTERLATLRRLGETLLALGEDDAAAERLEEARRFLEAQPSRFETAMIDGLEAEILARSRSLPLAVESLSQAARGFARVGRHGHQARVLVRRGELEQALGRDARVRATLAEVRDLLARHELHRPPEGIDRLERLVRDQPAADEPLNPAGCFALLVEALDHGIDGLEAAGGHAAAVASSLGAEAFVWIDAEGSAHVARLPGWEATTVAPDAGALGGEPDGFVRSGADEVYTCVDGRDRIVVRRRMPLQVHERELVRGLARIWADRRPGPSDTVPIAGASVAAPAPRGTRRFGLIGRSDGMRRVIQWIERVADTDLAVLVLGPNGSGKELVARALHDASGRSKGPFVAINCASIPASLLESELFGHERGAFTSAHAQRIGRFEQARGGTLFLDEIGEMAADMQAKLLRVLQERTFARVGGSDQISTDARIVAATNRDLQAEVERGNFRVDLYYRLNVVTIEVPALRDRLDDVEPLVRHFVARDRGEYRGGAVEVDDEVFEHLRHHDWPGNVRELENAVRNALVFGRDAVLRPEDFPLTTTGGAAAGEDVVEAAVRAIVDDDRWAPDRPILPRLELMIAHALVERVGNKTLAARLLGITKPTLYDRLRRYEASFGALPRDGR